MLSYSRIILFSSLLTLTVMATGCQRGPTWSLAPVEGTVTKDGRPLRHMEVVFLADPDAGTEGPQTRGKTDEAGHYRLRTDGGNDGAVTGKHRILLRDLEAMQEQLLGAFYGPQAKEAMSPLAPEVAKRLEEQWKAAARAPRVPPRYGNFNETPLRIEVQPGLQVIDFDVKKDSLQIR